MGRLHKISDNFLVLYLIISLCGKFFLFYKVKTAIVNLGPISDWASLVSRFW